MAENQTVITTIPQITDPNSNKVRLLEGRIHQGDPAAKFRRSYAGERKGAFGTFSASAVLFNDEDCVLLAMHTLWTDEKGDEVTKNDIYLPLFTEVSDRAERDRLIESIDLIGREVSVTGWPDIREVFPFETTLAPIDPTI